MLKFSKANSKLASLEKYVGKVYSFSLLSGHTCPYAKACLSKAIRVGNKTHIEDGPDTQFRCFSASEEAMYPATYDARKYNVDLLDTCKDDVASMVKLISDSIPKKASCIRIHVGGDFYNRPYFVAWLRVAYNFPNVLFYAYTKSLPFWVAARDAGMLQDNLILTASRGGMFDKLIDKHNLREAVVIANSDTCADIMESGNHDIVPSGKYKGYAIDHDDSHAALPELRNQSFALLVHGTQPKGTEASTSKKVLNGVGSYSKGKQGA